MWRILKRKAKPLLRAQNRVVSSNVRKGFGSFHSEDIEELIQSENLDLTVYNEISAKTQEHMASKNYQSVKSLFVLDPSFNFLNHGAFGSVLEPLLFESNLWRYQVEKQPLKFIDRDLFTLIAHTLQQMAKFINCPSTELLPLQNVTTGMNSILNSIALTKGDEVVCLSLTYGSTKKMLADLCNRTGATLVTVNLPLPITSSSDLVDTIVSHVKPGKTKLIILDEITSNTALSLPILEIASKIKTMCTNFNPSTTISSSSGESDCVVVVDAAHSLMSRDIQIYSRDNTIQNIQLNSTFINISATANNINTKTMTNSITITNTTNANNTNTTTTNNLTTHLSISSVVDFYLTNGHKWLCAPKGCAFLWVNPKFTENRGGLRPAIISHGFTPQPNNNNSKSLLKYTDSSKVLSAFIWDGCRDYSALLTVPTAINLWNSENLSYLFSANLSENYSNSGVSGCGSLLENARNYNKKLLKQATEMLLNEWGYGFHDLVGPMDMKHGSPMTLIPLPLNVSGFDTRNATDREAFQIQERLHHSHRIEVPIKCLENGVYVRISAHIYNTIEQYEELGRVIKNMK